MDTRIGIGVDSSQVRSAASDLDKLAQSGAAAEKSIDNLGGMSKKTAKELSQAQREAARTSKSIDEYIKSLQIIDATNGKSAISAKLYELSVKGASKAQLEAAESALKLNKAYEDGVALGAQVRAGALALAAATATAAIAGYAAVGAIAGQIAKYKDLADQTGETAQNFAALAPVLAVSGKTADEVAGFMVKLTKTLSQTDDESKLTARGLAAIGIEFQKFKAAGPVAQLDMIAKALDQFKDGTGKTAALEAIQKGGAGLVGFFGDLANAQDRQIRITQQQIETADAYTKAQAKSKAELQTFLQVIVVESLPAITVFIKSAKDMIEAIVGIDKNASQLKNNAAIRQFAEEAITYLGYLVNAADIVGRAFAVVGKGIGAAAAQQSALVRGEFREAINVASEFYEDAKRIATKPLFTQVLDKNRAAAAGVVPSTPGAKPAIDTSGLVKPARIGGGRNTAAQEAKAQLAFDIDEIKKSYAVLADVYANGERVLEAQRGANLITEAEYFEKKKQFLTLNAEAQEAALLQEKARLEAERLTGKDKIDNDRKIVDVEFKLLKVRQDAAASQTVLAIQVEAANKKIKDSYDTARFAAIDYLDSIKKATARELQGFGQGTKARDDIAARGAIDDRFAAEARRLKSARRLKQITIEQYAEYLAIAKETYQQEIALYQARTDAIAEKERNWLNGATEALRNYFNESQNIAKQTEDLFTNAFKGMEDALVQFVTTGKADFKSLANSILADITRIIIKQQITGPLSNFLSGALGGGGGFGDILGSFFGNLFGGGRASGGPVASNKLYRVNERGPELLNVAGRQYLMMGPQAGHVTSNAAAANSPVMVNQHFAFNGPVDRRTQMQVGEQAARGARLAQSRNG